MDDKRLADLKECFCRYDHPSGKVIMELITEVERLQAICKANANIKAAKTTEGFPKFCKDCGIDRPGHKLGCPNEKMEAI